MAQRHDDAGHGVASRHSQAPQKPSPQRSLAAGPRSDSRSVNAALDAAVRHLDVVAHEQEQAVTRILGLVELMLESAQDRSSRARLEGILEACAFQDLAGQRLSKVSRFLRHLSHDSDGLAVSPVQTNAPRADLLAPSNLGLSQEQVDRLLRGERVRVDAPEEKP